MDIIRTVTTSKVTVDEQKRNHTEVLKFVLLFRFESFIKQYRSHLIIRSIWRINLFKYKSFRSSTCSSSTAEQVILLLRTTCKFIYLQVSVDPNSCSSASNFSILKIRYLEYKYGFGTRNTPSILQSSRSVVPGRLGTAGGTDVLGGAFKPNCSSPLTRNRVTSLQLTHLPYPHTCRLN